MTIDNTTERHIDLVRTVMDHCNLYDIVMGMAQYETDDGLSGCIDVFAKRNDTSITIYKIGHGLGIGNEMLDLKELKYHAYIIKKYAPDMERINMVYVAPGRVKRIRSR